MTVSDITSDTLPIDRWVGVIGLGSMGGAMAAHLVRAGWQVSGFDPSEAARDAAAATGVTPVDSLDGLAGVPYIVLSLPSARIVALTVPALLTTPGTSVIVDTTTSEPQTSKDMADLCATHNTAFIDAPVSGGNTGAGSGTLASFVGGSLSAIDRAEPILHALTGGTWKHIGPAGAGNVVKLLNNMLVSVNLLAVAEATDVAAAYGIDLGTAVAAINTATGASTVSQKMFPDRILSGTFDSGFALGLMARDVALALDISERVGATPQLFAQTAIAWSAALADLGPQADFVAATSTFTTATDALNPASLPSVARQETTES